MKPSKKQNSKQDTKKNQIIEPKSAPKINQFFQTAPKTFHVENAEKSTCIENSKKYYIEALKNKLQGLRGEIGNERESDSNEIGAGVEGAFAVNSDGESCIKVHGNDKKIDEDVLVSPDGIVSQDMTVSQNGIVCAGCVQKTEEYKELELKYKELKHSYMKLTIRHCELDCKHNDLIKTGTRTGQPELENQVTFSDDIFSANEIRALKGLPLDKNKDSTFILQCLKYAYKNDLTVMCTKTLNGKPGSLLISEEGDVKEIAEKYPLTPQKVDRIRQLFIERLTECKIDAFSYGERIKDSKVNQLIATGIKNIAKKYDSK